MQTTSDLYRKRPTERNIEKLQSKKRKLQEIYHLMTEKEIGSAIRSVKLADPTMVRAGNSSIRSLAGKQLRKESSRVRV